MSESKSWIAVVTGMFLLATCAARAEVPAGSYSESFDARLGIWDLSGTYNEDIEDMQLNYTLAMSANGKFTGHGTAVYEEYGDHLDASFSVTGSIKTSGDVVRVSMNMKMTGQGMVEGYPAQFSATIKQALEVNAGEHKLMGFISGKLKVSVPGLGSESASIPRTPYEEELPDDMDGSWTLQLDVTPTGNKLTGLAAVELSNGISYDLNVTGSYSAKTDVAKLKLKGIGINRALSLSLTASATGEQLGLQSLKGTILGQKLVLSGD